MILGHTDTVAPRLQQTDGDFNRDAAGHPIIGVYADAINAYVRRNWYQALSLFKQAATSKGPQQVNARAALFADALQSCLPAENP
jgi:hypothetical protein